MQNETSTRLPTPEFSAEEVRARILWENEHLLIWDKPAGLPVHAGFGGGITLSDYLPYLQDEAASRVPALLHRLDRETSGCLALGKTDSAIRAYNKFFQQQRVQKTYIALVFGRMPAKEGVIDLPIRAYQRGASMRSEIDEARGQAAQTSYRVLQEHSGMSLVEAQPKTGRMHQIRVHFQAMGCPLAGDRNYGGQDARFPQLMLHAAALSLPNSTFAPALTVESPLPAIWQDYRSRTI
jgi:RluA family pseudouridine synthase